MWGEKWGEMIWGGAPIDAAQIPIGPWALMFLGFILGICAAYANRSRVAKIVPLIMVFLVPVVSVIAINVPNTFTNGTVADADEVNENFQALREGIATAVSSYETQVTSNGLFRNYAFIDHESVTTLCSDNNQCEVRVCYVSNPTTGVGSCDEGVQLGYVPANANYFTFEAGVTGSGVTGVDGDSAVTVLHDMSGFCEFVDADSATIFGSPADNGRGLAIRTTTATTAGQICSIFISD